MRGEIPILTEVRAEKWVYGGDSLARVDGRVLLTPFLLPGETARVRTSKNVRAQLVELVETVAERVAAPCPYFTHCGGCHYQHAPYELQLALKRDILREQLRRVGKIEYGGEIQTISGPPLEYRNRAQFHIVQGRVGYAASHSHELIPVEQCPISSPAVNRALKVLSDMARDRRFPRFVQSIEVFTNESEIQVNVRETSRPVAKHFFDWCAETIPGAKEGALEYSASGEQFRVSYGSFFQVNRFLVERLVEVALNGAEGESAIDLYAGVGLFALALARKFGKVTAVESSLSGSRDLEFNATRSGVALDLHKSRVEAFLAGVETAPDFMLLDPPRAGLGSEVTAQIERLRPRQITIVSCDPATLARDLAALPSYRIESIALVDLFPQTFHLETVARLRLAS